MTNNSALLPEAFLLSVVIPVYNEVATVGQVVERVRACGIPCEIILVDDGSTDGTSTLVAGWCPQTDLKIIRHPVNRGKGAALRSGFLAARGDVVLVQDADLEYDPAEYRQLIQPIVDGEADVVFGSRFGAAGCQADTSQQRVVYFRSLVGNKLITLLSNLFTGLRLSDIETCYKVFRRDVIQQLAPRLKEDRFGIEPELTARLARLPGIRVCERPIAYAGRSYAQGKKIGFRDGLRAVYCVVRYALSN